MSYFQPVTTSHENPCQAHVGKKNMKVWPLPCLTDFSSNLWVEWTQLWRRGSKRMGWIFCNRLNTFFDAMRKRRLILLVVWQQEKGPEPVAFNCSNSPFFKLVKRPGRPIASQEEPSGQVPAQVLELEVKLCRTGSLRMCLRHFLTTICGTIHTHNLYHFVSICHKMS